MKKSLVQLALKPFLQGTSKTRNPKVSGNRNWIFRYLNRPKNGFYASWTRHFFIFCEFLFKIFDDFLKMEGTKGDVTLFKNHFNRPKNKEEHCSTFHQRFFFWLIHPGIPKSWFQIPNQYPSLLASKSKAKSVYDIMMILVVLPEKKKISHFLIHEIFAYWKTVVGPFWPQISS